MPLVANKFSYNAGAGPFAVAVPPNKVCTGITCHAGVGGGSFTITPNGPGFTPGVAGDAIPVPAGVSLSLPSAAFLGSAFEWGQGTVFTFDAGIDSYFVSYGAV